ncbi:efflux RND transporter periplasmic adaptor subunit [Niveibacterium microcysteis]|uniref:Efflux RND transporter periplasmic adaptor subunit n=1 Tax=Niveibacterium microcysteis TaxID=2811415 RepID=A0ABX7M4C6_9RHOO|nr:efflux RND transporter periplasmic adaptor subunit [Niveibacterium microcysteis]QSI76597.1 efflux RND transporter periplasmic adaptor subunit [Niveibacterium microcysteis]
MNRVLAIGAGVVALAAAAGLGYSVGHQRSATPNAAAPGANAAAGTARKILYYRNPMGLPDTSPTPKKDPMGMDYIPVYEGGDEGESGSGTLRLSVEKIQKLGVRTAEAKTQALTRSVRALGRIEVDERRVATVSPKFEGWVERLHVNVTGQLVSRGQALFDVYSPDLVSAQREYAIASKGNDALKDADGTAREGMRGLAEASLARLRNWDISEAQIKELAQQGGTRRTLSFRSPVSGIVMEKKAVQGMRFAAGDALYQIADLSSVWVIADVNEQDVGLIAPGQKARITINAYPGKVFEGAITYVYPTLNAETRTVPVRVELANPGGLLKPGLFASLELSTAPRNPAVTVPLSAVIDSGARQIVLVQVAEGRFEPRVVKLGSRSESDVEVLDGVKAGEPVVTSANFLIDAESNLKAAVSSFGAQPSAPKAKDAASASAVHHGEGRIEAIDAASGSISLAHQPIASLKWPAMTMDFVLANASLSEGLKVGAAVQFDFVERQPGEWVVTTIKPLSAGDAAAHKGH